MSTDLRLSGVNGALPLPMNSDGTADFSAFARLVEWVAGQGVDGVTVNADTAEGAHLTNDERVEMIRVARSVLGPDVPVISGLMGTSTMQAQETARVLRDAGADALLVFSIPAFTGLPLPDDMVHDYYAAVAEQGLPLIAFSLTRDLGGAILAPSLLTRLAEDELIVGVKDASFSPLDYMASRDALRAAKRRIPLLSGCDNFIYESFLLGADGALLGYACLAGALTRQVLELVRAGDLAAAEKLNAERMYPLSQVMFGAPLRDSRARIKAAFKELGVIPNDTVRPPLPPISEENRAAMLKVTAQAGILGGA
jgi:4-hydroxy-tetrahydrodipicolinate synthase